MALLIDGEHRVVAVNGAARGFFAVDVARLPLGLVEATREGRLLEVLRAGHPEDEVRLTHRQRAVQTRLVPGPRSGETLMFLSDVTELRHLETVRQEFVANLSHELKTPITSLRLAAESLLSDPPPDTRARFVDRILKEADQVTAIIGNLRQLAEIEAGTLDINPSRFEMADLVGAVIDRLRLDDRVRVHVAAGLAVEADRPKLEQALGNLLDNAARFSPPGSPIEIEGSVVDAELRLAVRDHGPGISPEHWARVFERFYKVDPARSRASGGSGLGLAITKHLVLAQGGRVWTEAAREGGQRFTIAVPLGAVR